MSGGIKASVYNIEARKVLVTVQRGWEGNDVKEFLLEQPETEFVTFNSQQYYPKRPKEEPAKKSSRGSKKAKAGRASSGAARAGADL